MFSDRHYYRSRSGNAHSGDSIIMPLIFANIGIFILQNVFPGLTAFIYLNYGYLRELQLWRLGTYMFAHGNFFHILLNMWGIYIFGAPLEQQIGPHRFLKLYFISGLLGGIIWLIFNTTPLAPGIYPSVLGASGSVFGIMMAAAMLAPNRQYMLLIPPIPIRLKTLVAVYAGLEIYNTLQRAEGSPVAHLAHLGGLIGGYFFVIYGIPGWRGFHIHRFILNKIKYWRLRVRWWRFRTMPEQDYRHGQEDEDDDFDQSIDDILDKIGREGLSSLTPRERKRLEDARNRLKGKH